MGIKRIKGTLDVTNGIRQNGTDISEIYATKAEWRQNLASEFSSSATYAEGDAVLRNGLLYICTARSFGPAPWDSTKWQRALPLIQAAENPDGFSQDQITWNGYYYADVFWKESAHVNRLPNRLDRLYFDEETQMTYVYASSPERYVRLAPIATSSIAGIMKLYAGLGDATDGTITQKGISDELRKKVEIDTRYLESDERLDLKTE